MTQPSPKSPKSLTERQRFWRQHLLAAEQAGVRLSEYAECDPMCGPSKQDKAVYEPRGGTLTEITHSPKSAPQL